SFNFSGKLYKVVHYGLSRDTETIDFAQVESLALEHKPKVLVVMAHIAGLVAAGVHPSPVPFAEIVTTTTHKTLRGPRGGMVLSREAFAKTINSQIFPGIQGGPLMHAIAGKAVAFKEALSPEFKTYQKQIVANAQALAEALKSAGLRLCSGGTDNHLMLVDLRAKKLTGKVAEDVLGKAGITVNKNMIPFDPEKPTTTSGVRVGTPAITTRGMREAEMAVVGRLIGQALDAAQDDTALARVKGQVKELAQGFPLYASRLK
ncbi:MAG: serine hydroxymethyltransferase, partial [Myxococcaceae bacterium]